MEKDRKASTVTEVVGESGCRYSIQKVLQQQEHSDRQVYLACGEKQKWVVKHIRQEDYKYIMDIYRGLPSCPYLRLLHDTVPEQSLLVFKYCTGHLFSLAQRDLPLALTKRILKDALRGLAVLHDHDIVDTDIKATNIMMDWEEDRNGITVTHVQLTGLEDAVHIPPGYDIGGKQAGNIMWRSPEAHAGRGVNKPSDMFSFGIVCIYAVLQKVIFAVAEDKLEEEDTTKVHADVLERQISYFADEEGLNALLEHIDDSPWGRVLWGLGAGFNEKNPRRPFSRWENVDADFGDLIGGLTNFNPAKRLTAHEALAHRWFAYV